MGPFINLPFTAASFKQGLPFEKYPLMYTRHSGTCSQMLTVASCLTVLQNHFSPGNKAGSDMCGLWNVHGSTFQSPYGKVTNIYF